MSVVLDEVQLGDVTLGDPVLMKEIARELVTDTEARFERLQRAVEDGDSRLCAQLAHSVKGACANVGARAMAELLSMVERTAAAGDLPGCQASLPQLAMELERLREHVELL